MIDDGEVNIADVNAIIEIIVINESDWVDLGLPSGTIWTTRNVGASSPEDYGDYFAWGETEPKDYYDWLKYKWFVADDDYASLTKYSAKGGNGFIDDKTELELEDDAAYVHYPGGRMPSLEQFEELMQYCSLQWTQLNDVYGTLFTGSNGNAMFLPAAGYRWYDSLSYVRTEVYYWSRTLSVYISYFALGIEKDRSFGLTVRAVCIQ